MKTMQLNKITSAIAISMMVSGAAVAGIGGSKHDLGANGASQLGASNALGNTTEVCVFCHTPHGADTSAAVPLWNKNIPSNTYQRYSDLGTATLDGDEANIGSVSIACLSCHDGTQAMDSVINSPGSGMGSNSAGTPGNEMTGTPVPVLGTDLRNDHPVSIQYAGGACQGLTGPCTPASAGTGDKDFNPAAHASINGGDYWWINTSVTGSTANREKTDMILYTRSDFLNAAGTGPSVECASCHDPHNAESAGATSVSFMRIDNDGSAVCLACHIK